MSSVVRFGLASNSQRRKLMPLVMLTMRPGVGAVEIAEHRLSHQSGVQRRHAVGLVRADEGQMSHPHALVLAFLDQRDRGQHLRIGEALGDGVVEMQLVDHVDDLHVPRQQAVEQRHRPALQRLRQQRVIGVAQRRLGDAPGVRPGKIVLIDQDAHQLGDRDRRMGVVELDRDMVGQRMEAVELLPDGAGRCPAATPR